MPGSPAAAFQRSCFWCAAAFGVVEWRFAVLVVLCVCECERELQSFLDSFTAAGQRRSRCSEGRSPAYLDEVPSAVGSLVCPAALCARM